MNLSSLAWDKPAKPAKIFEYFPDVVEYGRPLSSVINLPRILSHTGHGVDQLKGLDFGLPTSTTLCNQMDISKSDQRIYENI